MAECVRAFSPDRELVSTVEGLWSLTAVQGGDASATRLSREGLIAKRRTDLCM